MADMSLNRNKMPEQKPEIRNKNFSEVSLGYSAETAIKEASRCLGCKNRPCVASCPVNVQIPEFIALVQKGDFEGAYSVISKTSSLPAVCGRVCPQELQCEGSCTRGIKGESVGIGYLERFVADYHREHGELPKVDIKPNGKKVAVIGGGPAGLTCAGDLARLGYEVTIFEAFHTAGGVLVYGIPEFRLPKAIVAHEIEGLKKLGVKIMTDMVIGRVLSIDEIIDMGFDAVFIGSGAGLPMFMGIEGENALGVYSANEFLTRINLMKAYLEEYDTPIKKIDRVAVIGGGNVAMDASRCAKRIGAKDVYVVYRRGEAEMPARREEVKHAKEEGIEFKFLCNPIRIISDENSRVTGIECIKMQLGEPDASGRRRPEAIAGSEFTLEVDAVIMALGTSPNPLLTSTAKDISVNSRGCIIVDGNMQTSKENVYAGGDSVSGAATVIDAMGAGKRAAAAIDEKLKNQQ
ncbi:MAG: NADPH-dependent glutamate synthase [Clostridia bacterium]|nr:NADPH-dependent glutamate synthase [Clostridia bacterium]